MISRWGGESSDSDNSWVPDPSNTGSTTGGSSNSWGTQATTPTLSPVQLAGIGAAIVTICAIIYNLFPSFFPSTTPPDSTATSNETLTPTPTELVCMALLSPADGVFLPEIGLQQFEWEEQNGAVDYTFTILSAGGGIAYSETTSAQTAERYMASIPQGGVYSWQVTALDGGGEVICGSSSNTFGKPKYIPSTNTPTPDSSSRGSSCDTAVNFDCDGFLNDVDSCPLNGDEGKGLDPSGCPITYIISLSALRYALRGVERLGVHQLDMDNIQL